MKRYTSMLSNYEIEPYNPNVPGHFSSLFKGTHRLKKHKVILKTHYDDISRKLLENEIALYMYLQRLQYPFIPLIKNIINDKNQLYIIMDYKPDHSYNTPITIERIEQWIHILRTLHRLNVVHRDIKPDNFLIEKDQIYIIDFGLATFYNKTPLASLIGNKKYCSYKCHSPPYVYTYNDDMLSLIYMCLDLHNGYTPWDNDITIKKHITSYYKPDPINNYLFMLFERYLSEW
jgi:serine/threonine protein kinase